MLPIETLLPGDPSGEIVYLRIVLSPEESSRMCFWTCMFYREGLLAPRPTRKLEDRPSSAVRNYLFKLFAATLHTVPLSATWGRAMPWCFTFTVIKHYFQLHNQRCTTTLNRKARKANSHFRENLNCCIKQYSNYTRTVLNTVRVEAWRGV